MSGGRRTEPAEPLDRARQRCAADLAELSDEQRRLRDPSPLTVGYTAELQRHARDTGAMASIDLTGKASDAEGRS